MTKIKSWTIFILLTLTLITLLIAPITVWYNLKHYSVYYAQHIPHKEDENPELVFILENLFFTLTPTNSNLEHERLSHRIQVLAENDDSEHKYKSVLGRDWTNQSNGHILYFYGKGTSYHWNNAGQFKYFETGNEEEKIYSKEYEKEANQKLSEIISPIIAIQPEPKINLQWLFNWIHQDRFNQD